MRFYAFAALCFALYNRILDGSKTHKPQGLNIVYHISDMSRKLARISEVMADGYLFLHMRELCEHWQDEADTGGQYAQDMMKVIDTFYRLCDHMKRTYSPEL